MMAMPISCLPPSLVQFFNNILLSFCFCRTPMSFFECNREEEMKFDTLCKFFENLRKCLCELWQTGKLLAIISNKNSAWILCVHGKKRRGEYEEARGRVKIYRRLSRFDGLPLVGLRLIVSFDATVSHRIALGHFAFRIFARRI